MLSQGGVLLLDRRQRQADGAGDAGAGAFAIIGLSSWIPAWLASLIVLLLALVGVVIFALMGIARIRRLSRRSGNPAKAAATDARIVKDVIDEF